MGAGLGLVSRKTEETARKREQGEERLEILFPFSEENWIYVFSAENYFFSFKDSHWNVLIRFKFSNQIYFLNHDHMSMYILIYLYYICIYVIFYLLVKNSINMP